MTYDNRPGSEDGPPVWHHDRLVFKQKPTLLDRLGDLVGNLLALGLGIGAVIGLAWCIAWLIVNFPIG